MQVLLTMWMQDERRGFANFYNHQVMRTMTSDEDDDNNKMRTTTTMSSSTSMRMMCGCYKSRRIKRHYLCFLLKGTTCAFALIG